MNKIIIFSKHFWPDNFKINILAKELVKRGHDITVLTSNPNYNNKINNNYKNNYFLNKKKWQGIKIYYLPIFRKKNYNWVNILINYLSHFISCFFYCHFFIKKKYDIVFVFGTSPIFQSFPAIYFSFLIRKPLILWVQDLWPESLKDTGYIKNKLLLSIVKFFVKINYILTDLILVQSEKFKVKIKKDFKLKKKILTYYNLSELKFQKFSNTRNKKCIITYAGNFGKAQDFETLFKVLTISVQIINFAFLFFRNYTFLKNHKKKNFLENLQIIFKNILNLENIVKIGNFLFKILNPFFSAFLFFIMFFLVFFKINNIVLLILFIYFAIILPLMKFEKEIVANILKKFEKKN